MGCIGTCRVGLGFPKVEVRFEHLRVECYVQVGSRALPTVPNFIFNMVEVFSSFFTFIDLDYCSFGFCHWVWSYMIAFSDEWMTQAILRKLRISRRKRRKMKILEDISGIIRPSRSGLTYKKIVIEILTHDSNPCGILSFITHHFSIFSFSPNTMC